NIDVKEIASKTNLQEVEVIRALQWLENKKALKILKDAKGMIYLDSNGEIYLEDGLPEKRFLKSLEEPLSLKEIKEKANLDDNEFNITFGKLKKLNAIRVNEKVSITEKGKEILEDDSIEDFLESLPLDLRTLSDSQKNIYNELKSRKEIIKTKLERIITVKLLDLVHELKKYDLTGIFIDKLTPEIIRSQSWKDKKFRRYDVVINVPKIYPAKLHLVTQAISYIRKIWLELGFKEMTGPIIDSSFWNFDSLFVPQDHPARELQDTFFLKNKANLPEKKLVNNVKSVHEKGWKYKWNHEVAKQLVLRTHTTSLSARTLAKLKQSDLPAKFFSVGKVFRNEVLDWSHLFEFHQTEGIVVDENVNFRHLLGYLKKFFEKMGFEKVRFRPGFFPYTEPNLEVEVFHPVHKKWIELGGAGIFRPEVVKPLLGKDIPVLAWGLGLERIIIDYYNIHDLRELYNNDLKKLRESKIFIK
ncbi:MAG: phenylalanine--tRNA ligase subunit alpha, partial [Nanoarchaeota archaeon]